MSISLLTTPEAAWYNNVRPVCVSDKLSKALSQEVYFSSSGSSSGNMSQVCIRRSSGQVKVMVTVAENIENVYFRNVNFLHCNTLIGNNYGSIIHRAVTLPSAWVFCNSRSNGVTAIFLT